ncbi:MAG: type II toxin-antitoxin system HicA family toxin [Elusimicrobia bacterium]|nr:type II toxin-antitoxin system HicA family toxin [Elusimicrobiota bacterium]
MRRKDFVRHLKDCGCLLQREGGKYSIFENPQKQVATPVTRHTEIADFTVRKICRQLGIPEP